MAINSNFCPNYIGQSDPESKSGRYDSVPGPVFLWGSGVTCGLAFSIIGSLSSDWAFTYCYSRIMWLNYPKIFQARSSSLSGALAGRISYIFPYMFSHLALPQLLWPWRWYRAGICHLYFYPQYIHDTSNCISRNICWHTSQRRFT